MIPAKYLIVGAWNTVFGYFLGLFLYKLFVESLHIIIISLMISFLTITMSFLTYKIFVFKTSNFWVKEYLRSFLVYGAASIFNVLLIWILVDFIKVHFWLAQGIVTPIMIIFSYLGHKKFTFN
jgi:putative flippase GtrA